MGHRPGVYKLVGTLGWGGGRRTEDDASNRSGQRGSHISETEGNVYDRKALTPDNTGPPQPPT